MEDQDILRVAVLDIDGTMIHGSLGLRLIDRLRDAGLGDPNSIARLGAVVQDYQQGRLSYRQMVDNATSAYTAAIQGVELSAVERVAAQLWAEVSGDVLPFVRPMLAKLRSRGLRPVVISSSPTAIVRRLADALEIADATGSVFATEDGRYGDRCEFMPGSPGGKLRALRRIVGDTVDLQGSFALGNAQSDACVLEAVGLPLTFEPTAELASIAARHGWTVTDRDGILDVLETVLSGGSRSPSDGR